MQNATARKRMKPGGKRLQVIHGNIFHFRQSADSVVIHFTFASGLGKGLEYFDSREPLQVLLLGHCKNWASRGADYSANLTPLAPV
jgi:hypothetical protein